MSSAAHVPLVLVADDEPDDIAHLARALAATHLTHKVIPLSGGEAAMNYLQRWLALPDNDRWIARSLLLLDWRMPGADGIAVLRWIRSQPRLRHLSVIVVSNSDNPHDAENAKAGGADACISKRTPTGELTNLLRIALTARQVKTDHAV